MSSPDDARYAALVRPDGYLTPEKLLRGALEARGTLRCQGALLKRVEALKLKEPS